MSKGLCHMTSRERERVVEQRIASARKSKIHGLGYWAAVDSRARKLGSKSGG